MPLKITGRHMTISSETKEYIEKKVERLRRLVPKIDELSFTIGKEKMQIEAEANFRAGKTAVVAKVRAEHVNEAIDILVDKLESQVTRVRKRVADKSIAAREAARVQGEVLAINEDIENDSDEDEAPHPRAAEA